MEDKVIFTPQANGSGTGSGGLVVAGGGHDGMVCDPFQSVHHQFNSLANRNLTADIYLAQTNILREVSLNGRDGERATWVSSKSVELAVEKTAAAAALFACQNTSDIKAAIAASAREAAECCCDMKALVLAQASETRALILSTNQANTAAQLAAAQAELTLLKIRFPVLPV